MQIRVEPYRGQERPRAFTLLEVLLAVAIAVGMLAVVLFFYTQAANLRIQLFNETAKISAARLLLDRLSSELSSARWCEASQAGLTGSSDRIEFVRLDLPNSAGWTNSPDPALVQPASPFRWIRYAAARSLGETNATGMVRTEESLQKRILEPSGDGDLSATNSFVSRRNPVMIDQFQFVRFRYWNGTGWLDAWTGSQLPIGVEVSLGSEPLPEEASQDEYPYELFRRIIFLPGHSREAAANGQTTGVMEDFP